MGAHDTTGLRRQLGWLARIPVLGYGLRIVGGVIRGPNRAAQNATFQRNVTAHLQTLQLSVLELQSRVNLAGMSAGKLASTTLYQVDESSSIDIRQQEAAAVIEELRQRAKALRVSIPDS